MGLDMHLYGIEDRSTWGDTVMTHGGFPVTRIEMELGYWRKHPDLHGFIVNEFAGGVDECQQIPLGEMDLQRTVEAAKANKLPHTEGFFFGTSTPDRKEETLRILEATRAWLGTLPPGVYSRKVYYQASW